MKFKNAPLIELIAEFRWVPNGSTIAANMPNGSQLPVLPLGDPARTEAFFSNFANEIGRYGYVQTERLVPAGWPYPGHFPVVRLRHPGNDGREAPTLYQIGAGLFSAHALPPYDTWDKFKPVIQKGLEVLLKSRPIDEQNSKFNAVTLRYIDRFSETLTGNVPPREFIERVLNVRLILPSALTDETADEATINPVFFMRVPLKSGLLMNLGINSVNDLGDAGILMDTSVVTQVSTNSDIESAMGVLETAHDSIRRLFMGLTSTIADKLEPEQTNVSA